MGILTVLQHLGLLLCYKIIHVYQYLIFRSDLTVEFIHSSFYVQFLVIIIVEKVVVSCHVVKLSELLIQLLVFFTQVLVLFIQLVVLLVYLIEFLVQLLGLLVEGTLFFVKCIKFLL